MVYRHRFTVVRDVVVATAVLVGLYGLGQGVQFQPVQIPAYLLIVGFDVLETIFGSAEHYDLLFALYLLGLGILGGVIGHLLHGRARKKGVPSWRFGAAGAFAVVGAFSLLFALAALLGTAQLIPVLITGVTGFVLLALAAWLGGYLRRT